MSKRKALAFMARVGGALDEDGDDLPDPRKKSKGYNAKLFGDPDDDDDGKSVNMAELGARARAAGKPIPKKKLSALARKKRAMQTLSKKMGFEARAAAKAAAAKKRAAELAWARPDGLSKTALKKHAAAARAQLTAHKKKMKAALVKKSAKIKKVSVKARKTSKDGVKARGTRKEVLYGRAERTSGGLRAYDLVENAAGRIVSKKKSEASKASKRFTSIAFHDNAKTMKLMKAENQAGAYFKLLRAGKKAEAAALRKLFTIGGGRGVPGAPRRAIKSKSSRVGPGPRPRELNFDDDYYDPSIQVPSPD